MTVEACPRCGDQTLWRHNSGRAWCLLCGHQWERTRQIKCDDPEAAWTADRNARTFTLVLRVVCDDLDNPNEYLYGVIDAGDRDCRIVAGEIHEGDLLTRDPEPAAA